MLVAGGGQGCSHRLYFNKEATHMHSPAGP
jgi:hypothetical protein